MRYPTYTYERFMRNRSLFRSWLSMNEMDVIELCCRDIAEIIADQLVELEDK